jgi:hypothetical protein
MYLTALKTLIELERAVIDETGTAAIKHEHITAESAVPIALLDALGKNAIEQPRTRGR